MIVGKTEELGVDIAIDGTKDLDFLSDFIGLRELTLSWLKTKRLFNFFNLQYLERLHMYRTLHLTSIFVFLRPPNRQPFGRNRFAPCARTCARLHREHIGCH